MLNEVKAEIIALSSNLLFIRNLTLVSLTTVVGFCGLAELAVHNLELTEQATITNVSRPSNTKIIVEQK